MDSITIALPIYLEMGKKKKTTFALNLNTYRNTHYQKLNDAKVLFEKTVTPLLDHLPRMKCVQLDYALFFGSNRAVDVANVCCIVDKFFCDTLVNCEKLPGDDKGIISNVAYAWGGVDTKNPHVKVTLSNFELSVEEPETPMQISFNQDEIKDALLEALEKQIQLQPGQTTRIAFDLDDPKDIIAYVEVIRGDTKGKQAALTPKQVETVKADAAQTQTRGRGKTAQAAATPVPAVDVATAVAAASDTKEEVKDVPFDVDTKAEAVDAVEQAVTDRNRQDTIARATEEAQSEPEVETKAEAIKTGNSIFPSAGSSAAPGVTAPAPGGKSLFANLTRPSGDAAKLN